MRAHLRHAITAAVLCTLAGCSSSDNDSTVVPDPLGDDTPAGDPDLDVPPVPGPSSDDPFGSRLELDDEAPTAGGPPSQPKNLRIDLVSNDWAEFSWAPANDDGEVASYRIDRSDGTSYEVAPDLTHPSGGSQEELDKYWATTSFIDCNFTRFDTLVHACSVNGPAPGDTFTYQVTAIDDEGQESAPSEPLTITYHTEQGAPIPVYEDFYLGVDDRFAQDNDLSTTAGFLDEYESVFVEEFDGGEINADNWNTQLTWGDTRIINGEQQYFVSTQSDDVFGYDPFRFGDSSLIIEAVPTPASLVDKLPPVCDEPDPLGLERCAFLSGALSSHDKFGFTYGYVEGRMKVSGTPGALSSFYLYHRYPGEGINRHAPEIDIVEYLGENPFAVRDGVGPDEDAFQTYHFADVNTGIIRSAPTMFHKNPDGDLYSDDFHTYGVLWEPQLVIWYIDGVEIKRLTGPQVSRQQMNIVTYLVAGSGWAPTPDVTADIFPLQYEIDYIRAWQRPVFNGNGVYPE